MPSLCSVFSMAVRICCSTELGSDETCDDDVFCRTPDTADSICVRRLASPVAEPLLLVVPVVEPEEAGCVVPLCVAVAPKLPGDNKAISAISSSVLAALVELAPLVCDVLLVLLDEPADVVEPPAESCCWYRL
jgi:hypothetical protein